MLFVIIFIVTFASGFLFTWWAAAIIAFVATFYAGRTPGQSFWSGFSAVALVWGIHALLKSVPNDHILASRVATMVHLPNWIYLLIVTMIIGGLLGGMSALSGLLVKRAFTEV
ncbi:hypothetical protein [Mucilaginibacter agri]|uniref:Uncharacterized protein n=1 Tax=Mucilaginibacter agri TaxID=2695265 RepID=A0A965ZHN4_9SPHI|nr:hypothetical protein [Mucilaginibacter agri]NCD71269.1 hypothetical protein [Mucilaginibacter agri]